jgi:predicted SAM-dependent methyltransferase
MSDHSPVHVLIIAAGRQIRRTGVGRAALDLRLDVSQRWLDRRLAAHDRRRLAELGRQGDVRLNVGSSTIYVEGWVSVDVVRDPRGEILKLDATGPWPFPAESLTAVNSEHFIEHVSREGATGYLREAFRALRPGAPIRTSTPDLEALCRAYGEAEPAILEEHRRHGYQAASHADLVNNYFYSHGHRQIYDFATLAGMLRAAGFQDVKRARFGESEHELLRGIDRHDAGSLNALVLAIDAVKPL